MKFHVVTPSMRHNKLPVLANSISAAVVPAGWQIEWRVRMMPRQRLPEETFSPIRDDLLWTVTEGFWMYISDDNLMHPQVVKKVADIVAERGAENVNCIMFAQKLNASLTRRATIEQLTTGDCEADGGAFVMNGAYYSTKRLKYHQFGLMERFLFKAVHDEAPDKFVFCNETFAFRDAQDFIFHL